MPCLQGEPQAFSLESSKGASFWKKLHPSRLLSMEVWQPLAKVIRLSKAS